MTSQLRVLAVTVGLFCAATSFAQTPAPAAAPAAKPAAAMSAPAAAPAPAAPMAKPAAPMAKPAAAPAAKTPTTAAAGGGDGKVWVNSSSKTYHCEGTKYYGKTKAGEYMTEADAKAKGNHADHGKACAK